jgi:hypothetical protein
MFKQAYIHEKIIFFDKQYVLFVLTMGNTQLDVTIVGSFVGFM